MEVDGRGSISGSCVVVLIIAASYRTVVVRTLWALDPRFVTRSENRSDDSLRQV
jgi:hypothetical protein